MLVDANLLIFAVDRTSPNHAQALSWLEGVFNGAQRVGLPWSSLIAFLRIATHPRIYREPLSINDAWKLVDRWLGAPASWIPLPTESHSDVLRDLIHSHQPHADLMPDAHLAALALEHGLTVYSADSDFARFSNVSWENPLTT